MACVEINIPVEVIEAELQRVYGSDDPVEVLGVEFDEFSNDVVFVVRLDVEDDEISEIDNWTVTTTQDFVQGLI